MTNEYKWGIDFPDPTEAELKAMQPVNLIKLAGNPRFWEMRDKWRNAPENVCCEGCELKVRTGDHLPTYACSEVFQLLRDPDARSLIVSTIDESSARLRAAGFPDLKSASNLAYMLNKIAEMPCQQMTVFKC